MRSTNQNAGFTVVELLTVMSIIIILMSVLVPAVNRARMFAKTVTQRGQFHEISRGLELFRNDHDEAYPDSGPVDTASPAVGYCGAMKLCEALIGQDGMGYHQSSNFHANQKDTYLFDLCEIKDPGVTPYDPCDMASLRARTKYVEAESIAAVRLQDIYKWDISTTDGAKSYYADIGFQTGDGYPNAVIFDVFKRATILSDRCPERGGQRVGMPVLYYKADPSKLSHDTITDPATWKSTPPYPNIYNFDDNYAITALGCPWESGSDTKTTEHPMYKPDTPGPRLFLDEITNTKATATPRPHNESSFILLSAGWDGLYGTPDDVYNFID